MHKNTHFISGFLWNTRLVLPCPRAYFYDTFNPVDFYGSGQFCTFILWEGHTIFCCCCFTFFFFQSVGEGLFSVCLATHKHTTVTSPKWRKKTRVFYGFQSSLIQSIEKVLFLFIDILFFLLSPNLSRSKTIVKTLWPRQTLQSGYPFHFLCQKRKRFFCEKKIKGELENVGSSRVSLSFCCRSDLIVFFVYSAIVFDDITRTMYSRNRADVFFTYQRLRGFHWGPVKGLVWCLHYNKKVLHKRCCNSVQQLRWHGGESLSLWENELLMQKAIMKHNKVEHNFFGRFVRCIDWHSLFVHELIRSLIVNGEKKLSPL